jgi:hypothetical protein
MSVAAAGLLKALLREAEAALESGEFEGLDGGAETIAMLTAEAREEAIGASPERLAELAERLGQALDQNRRDRASAEAESRRCLADRVARTWPQQSGPDPAASRLVRRARRDALAALAASAGPGRLPELKAALAALEAASAAAPPSHATGAETLPAWIERVEALLSRTGGDRETERSAGEERLARAKHLGAGAAASSLAAAAEDLAGLALSLEASALERQASAHRAAERARVEALALLLDPGIGPEERALLEPDLAGLGEMGEAEHESEGAATRRVEAVRQVLAARLERAQARLQASLAAAREAGIGESELTPSADPWLKVLRGTQRFLAGSARLEALRAGKSMEELEPRLLGLLTAGSQCASTLQTGPARAALEAALADLRIGCAGAAPETIAKDAQRVERLLRDTTAPGPAAVDAERGGAGPEATAPALKVEDLTLLEAVHPSAAKVWRALLEWSDGGRAGDVRDLLEQAVLEARAVREAQASLPHEAV